MAPATGMSTTAASTMEAATSAAIVKGRRCPLWPHAGEAMVTLNSCTASVLNAAEGTVVVVTGLERTALSRRRTPIAAEALALTAAAKVLRSACFIASTEGTGAVEALAATVKVAAAEVLAAKTLCYATVGIRNASAMARVMRPKDVTAEAHATTELMEVIAVEEVVVDVDAVIEPARSPTPTAPTAAAAEEEADMNTEAPTPANAHAGIV